MIKTNSRLSNFPKKHKIFTKKTLKPQDIGCFLHNGENGKKK